MARAKKSSLHALPLIIIGAVLFLVFVRVFQAQDQARPSMQRIDGKRQNSQGAPARINEVSFFVPYWNLDESIDGDGLFGLEVAPSRALYFGVPVSSDGIDLTEEDKRHLRTFVSRFSGYKRSLTLRMVNTQTNLEVFERKELWSQIAASSISLANEYGFDRVILDLEVSALPTQFIRDQIVNFSAYLGGSDT
ncbi:MAG: hypothetical protein UZ21_OP11001000650 [Microgenomates bacterium OLB22]|nr:MAG: hypothetical protein UZ21_OP11001000650 [Microgenomates bacterium OLB22]